MSLGISGREGEAGGVRVERGRCRPLVGGSRAGIAWKGPEASLLEISVGSNPRPPSPPPNQCLVAAATPQSTVTWMLFSQLTHGETRVQRRKTPTKLA